MAQFTKAEIDKRFDHHPPSGITASLHEHTRAEYKRLAETLTRTLPESRETSLAFTALEESLMWANASIARNTSEGSSD
jgi:hypothetical protein